VTLPIAASVTPVPLRPTGEPVTATLPVMVAVPVAAPAAVGENRTVMVQVPVATVRVPVQVPPTLEKGAVTATVTPVKDAVPVLVRVKVCVALLVPVVTFPKARGPPVTLTIGAAAGPEYSTAPISTVGPCGLVVLKKSWFGAPELLP
jgi:hypothetical protein